MYRDDVSRVLGAAFIFSANATHGIKLMNLIAKRDKFVGLTDYFVTELSKQNLKDSAVLQIIIAFEKVSFRDLTLVLSCTCVAVASLAGLGDLMDSTGLPLVAYYPFEIQYSPVYELVYVHQMVAVLIAAAFNVLLDIFSTNLVIQMCCQFRLLKREIKAIQQISPSDHEAVALRLQAVIERQCVLTKRCSDLSEIYGVPILGQFLGSILIICLGFDQFYRASEMNFYTLFSTLITIMWALMQAFFYCLHGNEIKTESESLGDVVMELPWYSYSPANKRKVLFMVHMGQRPTVLRAAGLINITLAALMTVRVVSAIVPRKEINHNNTIPIHCRSSKRLIVHSP